MATYFVPYVNIHYCINTSKSSLSCLTLNWLNLNGAWIDHWLDLYYSVLIWPKRYTIFYHWMHPLWLNLGTLWSWSHGSWIYNYLCNQCLSPLTLWVRIPLGQGVLDTTLCEKDCQWITAGQWVFFWVLRFHPPPYNWNIVESGFKHHNPNPDLTLSTNNWLAGNPIYQQLTGWKSYLPTIDWLNPYLPTMTGWKPYLNNWLAGNPIYQQLTGWKPYLPTIGWLNPYLPTIDWLETLSINNWLAGNPIYQQLTGWKPYLPTIGW
jgi:hypothetical protein